MSNGITLAEETEQRLRHELLRTRWALREMQDRREDAVADACRWRNCYENALHYLAILQPNLAEIAEDDLVQIWKASL